MISARFCGCAAAAILIAAPATAQTIALDIPAQPVAGAIAALARQARVQLVVANDIARGKRSKAVRGRRTVADALNELLAGTGLTTQASEAGTWVVTRARPCTGIDADRGVRPAG